MNALKKILIGISLLIYLPVIAFDIPEPDGYLTDHSGVLSSAQYEHIRDRLHEIEDKYTVEMAVFMFDSTEGKDIASLAFEVGNVWGVGKKENDNGIMFLIAIRDRSWFIASGYGVEGTLPDARLKRIGENNIPYHFKKGDYAGGIIAVIDDIEGYLKDDQSVIAKYDNSSDSTTGPLIDEESKQVLNSFLLAIVLYPFFIYVLRNKKKSLTGSPAPYVSSALTSLSIFFLTNGILAWMIFAFLIFISIGLTTKSSGGGSGGSGSGPWSSSSSSGGSSGSSSSSGGFGGGSFGGGGSGGKW